MPPLTDDRIRQDVLSFLEAFSGIGAADIRDPNRLQADLGLDRSALVFLAMSLRGYIGNQGGTTLRVNEIKKSSMTVESLVALVAARVRREDPQ